MKQMFDISEKLISEQSDEIYGVKTINWEDSSWKYLYLIGGESHQSLAREGLRIFRFFVMLWTGEPEPTIKNGTGRQIDVVPKFINNSSEYRALDRIDGEQMEFEWKIFPGFNTLQLVNKVHELLLRLGVTPLTFTGRIIFTSMFNNISWGPKDNKIECESNAGRFGARQWSFLGPGQKNVVFYQ